MTSAPEETPGAAGDTAPDTAPDTATATAPDKPMQPPSHSAASGHGVHAEQRLHRGGRGRMVAGVAGGLADYFDVDPTLVRIGFVALAFLGGLAVPLYAAGWLLIPDEDTDLSVAEELLARERAHGAF
jgi:phage shock protein PspC (stress-responsive transcriptional regulator)